jgi:hypothetical protein
MSDSAWEFLPYEYYITEVNEHLVRQELLRCSFSDVDSTETARRVCKGTRSIAIFITLVLAERPELIREFDFNKMKHRAFPKSEKKWREILQRATGKGCGDIGHEVIALIRDQQARVRRRKFDWSKTETGIPHYIADRKNPLPFLKYYTSPEGHAYCGLHQRVEIPRSCLPEQEDPAIFILKRFVNSEQNEDFLKHELTAFVELKKKCPESFYLPLAIAEDDSSKLFLMRPSKPLADEFQNENPLFRKWPKNRFTSQLLGLAEALAALNNLAKDKEVKDSETVLAESSDVRQVWWSRLGYHGAVQPETILISPSPPFHFQLGALGPSMRGSAGKGNEQTGAGETFRLTPARWDEPRAALSHSKFRAPEYHVTTAEIGPKYDIWSLGCVYLRLISGYLDITRQGPELELESYFTMEPGDTSGEKARVHNKVIKVS